MGWNSWNALGCELNESVLRVEADKLVSSGLAAAGYRYLIVDDCWVASSRDANGDVRPDPKRFPHGIKALADYVHAKGLRFGLYSVPAARTCAQSSGVWPGSTGSGGHEAQDARTFAAWGIDYLKYDYCSDKGTPADQVAAFVRMRDALRATHRPIVYSINPNSDYRSTTGASYDWSKVANLWRTGQDVVPVWYSGNPALVTGVLDSANAAAPLYRRAGPGHWNDPDMLVIGSVGFPGNPKLAKIRLSSDEAQSQLGLWAMMSAPLLAGNDLRAASPEIIAILTNRAVIAIDQDAAGHPAVQVADDANRQVWVRQLSGGDVAVALLNRRPAPATIGTTLDQVGISDGGPWIVTNLSTNRQSTTTGPISATLPGHGIALLRLRRT